MIRSGDNPEGTGTSNKFLVGFTDGSVEGHRGEAIMIRADGKQAILRGITFHAGRLLLVREDRPQNWPLFLGFWEDPLPTEGWVLHQPLGLWSSIVERLRRTFRPTGSKAPPRVRIDTPAPRRR